MSEWLALGPERLAPIVLAVLWVHVLLVAAACMREAMRVSARLRAFATLARPEGQGTRRVEVPAGPPIARGVREQVGRALDAPGRTVIFHDRAVFHELVGGRASDEGVPVIVEAAPEAIEVWVLRGAIEEPPIGDEERAWSQACAAEGLRREVSWAIGAGQAWIAGHWSRRDGKLLVSADPVHGLVISDVEPAPMLVRQRAFAIAFAFGIVVVGAACTALALVPPLFGTASLVGSFALLAFFLFGVIPGGHLVRERVTPPCFRPIRGTRTLRAESSEVREIAGAR